MKKIKILSIFTVLLSCLLFSVSAQAKCYCACVDNKKIKICENSWDANYVYCGGTYCSGHRQNTPVDNLISMGNYESKKMDITIKDDNI